MAEKINGTAVVFGLLGTVVTGLNGFIQETNLSSEASLVTAQDEGGITQTDVFYDPRQMCELVFDVTGTGIANAFLNATLMNFAPGTFIVITAAPRRPDLVATNWVVMESGPRLPGKNTELARITVPLRKRDSITGPAPV